LGRELAVSKRGLTSEQNYRRFCQQFPGANDCTKSSSLALGFLKLAAGAGHSDTRHSYAVKHLGGRFCWRDYAVSIRYAKMSAGQGTGRGQWTYGVCLLTAYGTAKDQAKAG
jgi:TPR repeat protein